MDRTQRKRPTIAEEWQLAVLRKLQSESSNPTEGQRLAAATETGLDEKWIKNWLIRQRSKSTTRNRKGRSATTEPCQPRDHSTAPQIFKLQLCYPPEPPSDQQGLSSRRSVSMPIDPRLCLPTSSRQQSPASFESRSPRPSPSAVNVQATSRSNRSGSALTCLNASPQNSALHSRTTTPTYSRDPLCNRYPDFSQFFRPEVHEQFRGSELSAPINNRDHLIQPLVNLNTDSHAPMYLHGLSETLAPLHPSGPPTHQGSSANSRSCPIAFSMRLADLLKRP